MTAGLIFSDMLIPSTLGVKIKDEWQQQQQQRDRVPVFKFANELAETLSVARNECLFAQF